MILPSKHLPQEKALLTVGAELLKHLDQSKTVSTLWEETRLSIEVSYDWYVLALDLLFIIDAIGISDGRLIRKTIS